MNYEWIIARKASGELILRTRREGARAVSRRVCTVMDAARILRRSRRHVYRYFEKKVLHPCVSALGTWLLDPDEVRRLARMPRNLRKPPGSFQSLFPEYPLRTLDPYRDGRLIMARILDRGGRSEIRWLLRRYPMTMIREFLREDGWRMLSARSYRFWCLTAGVTPGSPPEWRVRGRHWGGTS